MEGRKIWQMTQGEAVEFFALKWLRINQLAIDIPPYMRGSLVKLHKLAVREALDANEPVEDKILSKYGWFRDVCLCCNKSGEVNRRGVCPKCAL
jgi:hypothetical protein